MTGRLPSPVPVSPSSTKPAGPVLKISTTPVPTQQKDQSLFIYRDPQKSQNGENSAQNQKLKISSIPEPSKLELKIHPGSSGDIKIPENSRKMSNSPPKNVCGIKETVISPDRKRKLETSINSAETESKKVCSDQESNPEEKSEAKPERHPSGSSQGEPLSFRKKVKSIKTNCIIL